MFSSTDTFTDIDGTAIATHNGDWAIESGALQIQGNRLYSAGTSGGQAILSNHEFRDGCSSYDVQFPLTEIVYNEMRVITDTGSENNIYSYLNPADDTMFIGYQTSGGAVGFDGGQTPQLSAGTHNYKLCTIGDRVMLSLDNSIVLDHTDYLPDSLRVSGKSRMVVTPGNYVDNYVVEEIQQQAPSATISSGATINAGDTYATTASFIDPDSARWTTTVNFGDGSNTETLQSVDIVKNFALSHLYTAPGTYTVTFSVTDDFGATGTNTATVVVNPGNVAPAVSAISVQADPAPVNTAIAASASFTDSNISDTHSASWNWGDGTTTTGTVTESNGTGSVANSHTYTAAGIYTVTLTVTDNSGGSATRTFEVKYQQGDIVPSGKNVELSFPAGNIDFVSTSYLWLVVNSTTATFRVRLRL